MNEMRCRFAALPSCGVAPSPPAADRRSEKGGRRPGVWGKVAVRPSSSFSRAALTVFSGGGGSLILIIHHIQTLDIDYLDR